MDRTEPVTLLVLGAGASWPLPQTPQLTTELVDRRLSQSGLPLFQVAQSSAHGETFEQIMSVLADAQRGDAYMQKSHGDFASNVRSMLSPGGTLQATCVDGFLEAAHYIAIRLADEGRRIEGSHQARIARALLPQGRTIIATLNYDDTVLSGGPFAYDGFEHGGGQSEFSPMFSSEASVKDALLLWLHGSIHFNIHGPAGRPNCQMGRIYWDDDEGRTVHGWTGAVRNDMFDLPIVIGSDKPRQIMRSPFLQYWSTLLDCAPFITRLVVIGYGGSDEHLNQVLQNIVMWQGRRLKLVLVTRGSSWDECLPAFSRAFPTLFNRYAPCTPAQPGSSLQKVISPPTWLESVPEVWADLDGVQDLAQATATERLLEALH